MVSRDLHLPGLASPPVPGRMDGEEAGVFNLKKVSTRARQFWESRGSAARLHPMSPKASCAPPPSHRQRWPALSCLPHTFSPMHSGHTVMPRVQSYER